ncbi:MAG TPA: hypothetical protein DEB17_09900 [Chlorobaculum sp.]|uniref:Uncharacterized protein n=1 Tax=Chlorobaculum tepidum (strain ATCC 49652 / DSM 12025 / NBRC 103806 / TLS) TaxID=194439 RepID=Q8KGE6_CHLTE|nr:hypothetical protein CT0022 [Chlorobaculum tepidum TLS]HBU24279.1 hypothetical protein [Chlorobaculum sp.]
MILLLVSENLEHQINTVKRDEGYHEIDRLDHTQQIDDQHQRHDNQKPECDTAENDERENLRLLVKSVLKEQVPREAVENNHKPGNENRVDVNRIVCRAPVNTPP